MIPASRVLENIRKGKLSPGYALIGRQVYWRDRIWAALREAMGLAADGNGLIELDLKQTSLDAVIGQAQSRSLWAPRQLLLVRNVGAPGGAKAKELLGEYFKSPNPDAVLVFEMLDVDPDSGDWREKEKAKSRIETWDGLCDAVLLVAPDVDDAVRFVIEQATERGVKINAQVAERIVTLLERNMGRMAAAVESLALYADGQPEISEADVALMLGSGAGPTGGSLAAAVGSASARRAVETIAELHQQSEYAPLVAAEVVRYLRQLMLLKEAQVRDPRQASRVLWTGKVPAPPDQMGELLRQARGFSAKHLARAMRLAYRTDIALRSSPPDERALLERLILSIMRPLLSPLSRPLSQDGARARS
ncbi:MAG: DNA polymerase III subunit delta [Acidobacteria bacterium]|nr:DNA polymerase III subunit delta [Acidobacteriota bacterium]